jgi:aminoglycoside 2'-N-acetyltransferase I
VTGIAVSGGGAAFEIHVGHTAAVAGPMLGAARDLLDLAFGEPFPDHDWDHALGGIHAIVTLDDEVVGHASVVARRFLHAGRALRAGYVEAVGVHPDVRRRGVGRWLMVALDPYLDAYDLGALAASDDGAAFYRSLGWLAWRGPLFALTTRGAVPTPEEQGGIFVRPGPVPLDLDGSLTCDWRDGDVW